MKKLFNTWVALCLFSVRGRLPAGRCPCEPQRHSAFCPSLSAIEALADPCPLSGKTGPAVKQTQASLKKIVQGVATTQGENKIQRRLKRKNTLRKKVPREGLIPKPLVNRGLRPSCASTLLLFVATSTLSPLGDDSSRFATATQKYVEKKKCPERDSSPNPSSIGAYAPLALRHCSCSSQHLRCHPLGMIPVASRPRRKNTLRKKSAQRGN